MMGQYVGIAIRAVIILIFWAAVGAGVNLFSAQGVPWVYEPPTEKTFEGVKVPLIDEKKALEYFQEPGTIFLDTRKADDYAEACVKGSLSLPAAEKEEKFAEVQALLPEDSRIVLYCYGPECEDADHVAEFLAQLGYKNLIIMSSGFPGWKKAGYPVESRTGSRGDR